MKKRILITIGIILGIILLDSTLALVFNNNPVIKIKEYYNGGDLNYISKSLFVDTYNCINGKKDTVIKGFSYSCSNEINDVKEKIEIVKNEMHNLNKFNKYLEINNRIIYITSNIKEVYYYSNGVKYVLKDYISKMWHTTDDAIKEMRKRSRFDSGIKVYQTYDDARYVAETTVFDDETWIVVEIKIANGKASACVSPNNGNRVEDEVDDYLLKYFNVQPSIN
jgi:hypothetical protein